MEEHSSHNQIIGKPEEISQMIENNHLNHKLYPFANQYLASVGSEDTPIKIE